MSTFRNYLLGRNQSIATVEIHEGFVHRFSNWCDDENIEAKTATYAEILSYMQYLRKGSLKQRTIQMHLLALSHYFKWCISIGLREDQPTEGIEVKGVQRKFLYHNIPMTELEAVYERFKGSEVYLSGTYRIWDKQMHYTNKIQKVVYGLMIWQGLEAGELKRLKLEDLKLREGKIYIAGGRRSNERTLKLESVQIMDLMEYLQIIRPEYQKTNPKPTESLFISLNGGEWGNNFMTYLFKALRSYHSQIKNSNQVHASVITYWLKTNNLRQVQYMAGHRYVSSTEAYLINDLDDLHEEITKFHPMG